MSLSGIQLTLSPSEHSFICSNLVAFQSLMSKGLHVHIVQAMKQHSKDAGVQIWGYRALRGLSLSGYADKEIMIKCGVLELAFSCTRRYCHLV